MRLYGFIENRKVSQWRMMPSTTVSIFLVLCQFQENKRGFAVFFWIWLRVHSRYFSSSSWTFHIISLSRCTWGIFISKRRRGCPERLPVPLLCTHPGAVCKLPIVLPDEPTTLHNVCTAAQPISYDAWIQFFIIGWITSRCRKQWSCIFKQICRKCGSLVDLDHFTICMQQSIWWFMIGCCVAQCDIKFCSIFLIFVAEWAAYVTHCCNVAKSEYIRWYAKCAHLLGVVWKAPSKTPRKDNGTSLLCTQLFIESYTVNMCAKSLPSGILFLPLVK